MQVQRHVGRLAAKPRNGLRNAGGRVAGGLVEHRHVQLAAHALVNVVHAVAKRVGGGQQAQGFAVDALTLGRERKPRAAAPAQREAEPGFEILEVAADGGGADVELQLGRSQPAAFGHGLEHPQQAQIHVAHLPEHGARLGVGGGDRRWRAACGHWHWHWRGRAAGRAGGAWVRLRGTAAGFTFIICQLNRAIC